MSGLLRLALAQLRVAWPRTLAAAAAVLVAVGSFLVLTGTVSTQQLRVTETVNDNYRSTYDILVRPHGAQTAEEQSDGSVRPNFLATEYGGITDNQVKQIAQLPGVQVAAPVAVVGQVMRNILVPVDVSQVLGNRDHAMIRFGVTGAARNGSATTTNQNGYLYLTRQPLTTVDNPRAPTQPDSAELAENRGGTNVTACLASDAGGPATSPATAFQERCWSAVGAGDQPPRVEVSIDIPLTVEAVDPAAEEALTGLSSAMVSGRMLAGADDSALDQSGPAPVTAVTAVMASKLPMDYQATVRVDELSDATADQVLATTDPGKRAQLVLDATPSRSVARTTHDAADLYQQAAAEAASAGVDQSLLLEQILQPGDVAYSGSDPLQPKPVPFDADAWRSHSGAFLPAPSSIVDTGYRNLASKVRTDQSTFIAFNVVGSYDPAKVSQSSSYNEVPLETYRAPTVSGADSASKTVLGGKPLRSDLNPTGYLQSPPALLVPMKALPALWKSFSGLDHDAPVSSVRVRVGGIHGLDAVAREKIRLTAERIQAKTGLDVDITIGASLENRTLDLPASAAGTPTLHVTELWTKKGVAVTISDALDIKSLVLFILILVSSALTIALISAASVAARRTQLGTLSAIGWTSSQISRLLSLELIVLGFAAGVLGALVAVPIAMALGIVLTWWQVLLAVPLGMALSLLPGIIAAAAVGRVAPADAFRPRTTRHTSAGTVRLRGVVSLALLLGARRRGRATVAAVAVGLATACAVAVSMIVQSFNGAVVGSFLGNAVALHVRGPDIAAIVILSLLGLTAVVTVTTLAVMDDKASFATLRAIGWHDRKLALSLTVQNALIGAIGAAVGAVSAIVTIGAVIGAPIGAGLATAVAAIAIATLACCLAALFPAALLRRLPVSRILAAD
ncbi:ABC transporter permease [uncultured Leifsonia sp.]|uniref:ABC transporter permease n=1 Tax=uncultured Leifsonia sp. TaxID=340359 RepID=UPI0028D18617|nr:ABC transporter permease [uncultured Leifsonia sp.]